MNWSKIQTIFIIVFLLLNLFLGYQLLENQTRNLEVTESYDGSLEELLHLNNMSLEAELSGDQPDLAQLHVQDFSHNEMAEELESLDNQQFQFDEGMLLAELHQPYELDTEWNMETLEESFMPQYVFGHEQYQFDRYSGDDLVYLQTYESYPIFIAQLVLSRDENGDITGYEQTLYEKMSKGTEQTVISAYTAIRTLVENQVIPRGATIQHVTLGYYGQVYEVDSQVLTPTWRVFVEYEEEWQVLFVNGITGAIESSPSEG